MHYDWVAIPDAEVPAAADLLFRHVVETYASETNKTAAMWRAIPDALLDFRPHEKCNPIRTILVHQLLSERRFFAEFVGTQEPPVDQLLPAGGRVHRQVRVAGAAAAAATRRRPRRVVGRRDAVFRRVAAAAAVDVLAPRATYLPPPHPGAGVAAAGRGRVRAGRLRAVHGCQVGRRRSHVLPRGG